MENLKGFQAQGLSMDPAWFDEDGDITVWCGVLAKKWETQGVRMAAVDIDSDSYVLFPALTAPFPALQTLAEEIGHRIDFVEKM